jgi:hypothetical protein
MSGNIYVGRADFAGQVWQVDRQAGWIFGGRAEGSHPGRQQEDAQIQPGFDGAMIYPVALDAAWIHTFFCKGPGQFRPVTGLPGGVSSASLRGAARCQLAF